MNEKEFKELISKHEGRTLDYKSEAPDLDFRGIKPAEKKEKIAEFLKDLLSFANTIRGINENAYIVYGIEENNQTGDTVIKGISKHIDDAIIQTIVKDKISPSLVFNYKEISFEGKRFGLLCIPVFSYGEPYTVIRKIGNLSPKEVWLRRGSSKDTANPKEIAEISKWLERAKKVHHDKLISISEKDGVSGPVLSINKYLEITINKLEIEAFIKEVRLNKNIFSIRFELINLIKNKKVSRFTGAPSNKLEKLKSLEYDLLINFIEEIKSEVYLKIYYLLTSRVFELLSDPEKVDAMKSVIKNISCKYWTDLVIKTHGIELFPDLYGKFSLKKGLQKEKEQYTYSKGKVPIDVYKTEGRRTTEVIRVWISDRELKDLRKNIDPILGTSKVDIMKELQFRSSHYATDLPRRTIIKKLIPAILDRMFINSENIKNGKVKTSEYGLDLYCIGLG
ncbi:MAG: ATP-binding protein [Alphaproteobacteria bacterium]|nr:ATP-binding protein [Alphaproteobacteria bacterium]